MNQQERKRILLIDDNIPLLRVLGDFLMFRGFEVVVAESGEEGLEKMVKSPPDIILLDISMPGMGGIGFLKRIMSNNGTLPYPVLVFTARTTTEDYFRGIPVDGFIAKPCDKSELVNQILAILDKHKKSVLNSILVGEDDQGIAARLVAAFREAGFEVDEAATGPEILEKAVVCMPDIILVKRILTGMNGDSVVSILQAMPRTQSIPVVLYDSGSIVKNVEEEDRLARIPGIAKYLPSDDAVELVRKVKEILHCPA